MVQITETFFARSRNAWRKWLENHHASKKEIWLLLLKKHVQKACVSYDASVEEALCFGWIDGLLKRIDDEKHALRFSPRKPRSVWSSSNQERVARMVQQGRMTEAGLAAIEVSKRNGQWQKASNWRQSELALPKELEEAFARDPQAREKFYTFAPSYQKMYIAWVLDAKRPETRAKRSLVVLMRSREKKKPGIDL